MDLQDYLTRLNQLGQLRYVTASVQCDLELAALCRREFLKPAGGKALYFRQLSESTYPVVANLFGSEIRAAELLHSPSIAEFADNLKGLLQERTGAAAQRLSSLSAAAKIAELSETVLETASQIDLLRLPAIRSWPKEVGRYLTLALAVTEHPLTGATNVGLYRAQIRDAETIALNFAKSSGAAQHLQAARELNQALPVALVLGCDPALLWVAAAPLPADCSEFDFYAQLFAKPISFTAGVSQAVKVPAEAEMVIEGHIVPGQTCHEGPFGNHTGSYVTRHDCPLMQVTAVRQKPQAVLPMTVVGPPPSENIYLGKANEILIRELLQIDFPQIHDLRMPLETIFHGASLITIRSAGSSENRELIDNLWNDSPLRCAKLLILMDEDVQLHSFARCWWRAINQLDAKRIYQNGIRIAIDATGVDPARLVVEDQQTRDLINARRREDDL